MSSLASEIKELFALHQSGALTDEEFSEAKQAIIQQHRAPNADSVTKCPPQALSLPPVESKPHTNRVEEQIQQEKEVKMQLLIGIRLERAWEGISEEGEQSFFVSKFTSDWAGDFLVGATESLEVLSKVLTNLLKFPDKLEYKKLNLTNGTVRRTIMQTAALEFLLVNGGKVVDGFINLEDIAANVGLEKLQVIQERFNKVKQLRDAEREKAAENNMAAALQRERRRLERNRETELSRQDAVTKRSRGEGEPPKPTNRVPLEEALKYLTGQKSCDR